VGCTVAVIKSTE